MSHLMQSSYSSSSRLQGRWPHACLLLVAFATLYLAYRGLIGTPGVSQLSNINAHHTAAWQQDAAYMSAATANITRFKRTWFSKMVKKMQITGSLPNHGLNPADWQLFKPILTCPKQRPLQHYGGDGDGSKYLCDVGSKSALRPDCVIYSMGSRGDYKFEQDMLKHTSCQIHTFDCTFNGTSQGPRHTYHKWCIAAATTVADKGPPYKTWTTITKSLQHDKVDILKMDVEGYEYEVIGEFEPGTVALPDEIGIEVHVMIKPKPDARPWLKKWLQILPPDVPHTVPALGFFFLHLANLGYGVYSIDSNTGAPECCSEFSLLRIG